MVLDAGIATEENIAWLTDNGYHYVVVSRRRHRQFDADRAVWIENDGDQRIQAQRIVNATTGEVELYCHSSQREEKEKGIGELFAKRFEEAVEKLAAGLQKKGTVKRYDKVMERIGRNRLPMARIVSLSSSSAKMEKRCMYAKLHGLSPASRSSMMPSRFRIVPAKPRKLSSDNLFPTV